MKPTGPQVLIAFSAASLLSLIGCGGAVPETNATVASTAPSRSADPSLSQPESAASSATATDASPLDAVPPNVREELDLFAFSTLQIQRVRQLQSGSVQRKLKLTDEQIAVFSTINDEVEELAATLQSLKPDERQQKLRTEFRPKAGEFKMLVDEQLDDVQKEQLLNEVLRRQRGAIIFLFPGVPERLGLTDAQLAKLYTLIEETRQSVDFDNLQYNPLEIAKLVARATAARNTAEEQLTPPQRAKFDRLLGK